MSDFSDSEDFNCDSEAIPIEELIEACKSSGIKISGEEELTKAGNEQIKSSLPRLPSDNVTNKNVHQRILEVNHSSIPQRDTLYEPTGSLVREATFTTSCPVIKITNNESEAVHNEDYTTGSEFESSEAVSRKSITPTTRSKRRKLWKRTSNQEKRMRGEAYTGFQTIINPATKRKITPQTVAREARQLGPSCTSKFCQRSKNRHCPLFTDEKRQEIFNEFWLKYDWKQRRTFVQSLVDQTLPKSRKVPNSSRRGETRLYYLKNEGRREQVCFKLFISTLGIKEKTVRGWLKTSQNENKRIRIKKTADTNFYKRFLASVPKQESHYCRQNTSKQYLDEKYKCKFDVYEEYQSKCLSLGVIPTSIWTFYSYFEEQNFEIHQPKKDYCDICAAFKKGNITQVEYDSHQQRKEEGRNEKRTDKEKGKNGDLHIITMDVQKVLLCPVTNASALYYKTKLAVHNFTIYDLVSGNTECFLWDETQADLVASSFATCLVKYFEKHFTDDKPIVVFSDGCTYQNRNAVLSGALLYYSVNYKKIVIQKYLEKGHTQMECDSVHRVIEKNLKNREIFLPTDYKDIILECRKNNTVGRYEVSYLEYADFVDYTSIKVNIRPGSKSGDPVVTDLRQIKYTPDGFIFYKLNHSEEWQLIPRKISKVKKKELPVLHSSRLKIPRRKYQDLQDMLHVLPQHCHEFYKNIPF